MDQNIIIFTLILTGFVSGDSCRNEKNCKHSRIHGMKSVDCYNDNFKNFPQCLKSDVEIIDLSYNRIRKITKKDLKKYTSLKMLYLSDNLITKIDDAAFEDKNELHTLDLSINGLTNLPPVVFHLPSLKSLYLSQNQNINIADTIEKAKPITSPLRHIDISFNELDVLPNLGIMPYLVKYNISGNGPTFMSTKDISGLCSLQILVNNNFSAYFDNPCDCFNINRWLRERKVQFTLLNCEDDLNDCIYKIPEEDMNEFTKCKEIYDKIILNSKLLKILIPIAVILILIIIFGIYFITKHKKRRIKKYKNKSSPDRDGKILI